MKIPEKIPVLVSKDVDGGHLTSIEYIGKDDERYDDALEDFILWNEDSGEEE